ncbi:hypothetical protein JTE90_029304 [Oedothorax gibbosus]|uniref:Metalloendopeptidase OMA1, mitochondrial n=1 Tax=Oedothorax gibbosus TaxID=931172 RepID=A0AAV6TYT9_9ARAC|nr:hypothetical protein JTE90_029304 [Oedothorax gibbosus]
MLILNFFFRGFPRSVLKLNVQSFKTLNSTLTSNAVGFRTVSKKTPPTINCLFNKTLNPIFKTTISGDKTLLNSRNTQVLAWRCFKTSEQRHFHPIVWIVLKPVFKFAAILTGRGFRKWWRDLPKNKRQYFLNELKANSRKILIILSLVILLSILYYVDHLEETPITKRIRFMAFNDKQLEQINEFELQQIMNQLGEHILPETHYLHQRVEAVVKRILLANTDIEEMKHKKFGIAVIDNSIENAFVLPIGYVFVFTGMLKLCSNDDQLGIILSHEIAHCLQNHGAENVSFSHLLDLISIAIIAAIWAVVPSDSISLLTHWLFQKSVKLLFELPYNRKIETEADKVGLQLAAKACFDVRESSAFWAKMAFLKNTLGDGPEIEFLSTHPSHEKRSEYLDSIMDEAITFRKFCGCPNLSYRDPRNDIETVSKALEMTRSKYFERNTKPEIIITKR